jgi:hypothetical protein
VKWWSRLVSDVLDWMGRGFGLVLPETFIPVALAVVAAAWFLLSRVYQRCPHCRRVVRRVRAGTVRCRHCDRQYYRGLRHVG